MRKSFEDPIASNRQHLTKIVKFVQKMAVAVNEVLDKIDQRKLFRDFDKNGEILSSKRKSELRFLQKVCQQHSLNHERFLFFCVWKVIDKSSGLLNLHHQFKSDRNLVKGDFEFERRVSKCLRLEIYKRVRDALLDEKVDIYGEEECFSNAMMTEQVKLFWFKLFRQKVSV